MKAHQLLRTLAGLANDLAHLAGEPSPGPRLREPDGVQLSPELGAGNPNETTLSPFEPPETTVLRSPLDTANCGEFAFSLYNTQLIVSMLGTGGGMGGEYDVSKLPLRRWTGLRGRDGTPLPVLVFRDHGTLSIQVGHVDATHGPDAGPTR
jgi:hypothetical protein